MMRQRSLRHSVIYLVCFLALCASLFMTGCAVTGSASYRPPFLPLRFTIDTAGHVSLQLDATISTEIGDFGVGAAAENDLTPPPGGILVFVQRLFDGEPTDAVFGVSQDASEKIIIIDNDITLKVIGRIVSIDAKKHHTILITTPQAQDGLYDSLKGGNDNGWSADDGCAFQSDGYHITDDNPDTTNGCIVPFDAVADAQASVTVQQISGDTGAEYGFLFRASSSADFKYCQCYAFAISSDGHWEFTKTVRDQLSEISSWQTSDAIHTGLNAVNTLAVDAQNTHFAFFINGTQVGEADDSSIISGETALNVSPDTECVFTDFLLTR